MDVLLENMMLIIKTGHTLKLLCLHSMQTTVSVSKAAHQFRLLGLHDTQKAESVTHWVEANRDQGLSL